MEIKKVNKKGIILTLDAILALIAAIALLSTSFFYLSQTHTVSWIEGDLGQLGMDALTTLEISRDLNWSMAENNVSNLEEFCDVMFEPQICTEIRLYNVTTPTTYSLMLNYTMPACVLTNATRSATTRRLFVFNEDIMIAEMEVWYR